MFLFLSFVLACSCCSRSFSSCVVLLVLVVLVLLVLVFLVRVFLVVVVLLVLLIPIGANQVIRFNRNSEDISVD